MKIDYRSILQKEFETRKIKNPSYNLSSFARLLKIKPSRLSEILRGKVGISASKASTITSILNFSENERSLFLDLVSAEHSRSPKEREEAYARIENENNYFFKYDLDNFQSIADWYHHAIIELINLNGRISKQELANALGIDTARANHAIERLQKLNIIEKTSSGYNVLSENRTTPRDIPSEAIKKLNEQILEKATQELRRQNIESRDYSIIFYGFNKEQMKIAKERIREFRRNFMKEFESSIGKDSVYCMAIQMFEITNEDYSQAVKVRKDNPTVTK